jgi:DNA-binding transcriptional ArsR family regulator
MLKIILFDSNTAAQKIAYQLQGTWDDCNAVEFKNLDYSALIVASDLVEAKWCEVGSSEFISDHTEKADLSVAIELSEVNPLRVRLTFPVARAEVYWAVHDWKGGQNAESISRGTGISKSTVQSHLCALEKAKAICSLGRPKQYTITESCPQDYLLQLEYIAPLARLSRGLRGRPLY